MLTLNTLLHYIAAGCCLGVAVFALVRDCRSFVHRIFALGMVLLALESFFNGRCAQVIIPDAAIRWQHWRFVAATTWPGVWLLFSLSFGREDFRALILKYKWAILSCFLLPLIFVSLLWTNFFRGDPIRIPNGWGFGLDWSGYGFHLCFLLVLVMILMMLEKTLRASKGRKRWQVKFMVLGMGGFFASRIFTGSYALIFHAVDLEFDVINAATLLAANLLIVIAMLRNGVLQVDIYMSQKMLYNSITVMVVGVYFLALGISSKIMTPFLSFPLVALFVFLSLLGLLMVLLSDRVRVTIKRLISRHFRRPMYDYRNVWMAFTARTVSLVQEKAFCEEVVKMISQLFDILSVSIWIGDNRGHDLRCAGSTVVSDSRNENPKRLPKVSWDLTPLLDQRQPVIDLEESDAMSRLGFGASHGVFFTEARIRYLVPLKAGDDVLGFISLDDRVRGQPLSFEESDLLRTIADHAAAGLLNLKLSEHLRQAREMQAFQTLAAFFVHDLKNLASKLSMTLENLPVHFDNPAFRDDALRLMSQSVDQINAMCGRLSVLREKLDIHLVQTDLNQVVTSTLSGFNGPVAGYLVQKLDPLPKILADPEQIQKVVFNLILNAGDAVGHDGEIVVTTGTQDGWVEITVSDNGCGISREFMDHFLFRPFKTTKPNGTGIGLFQSKMIVEAHNGRIEVESRKGEGSTFRVLLPV
jgi:putative PEP-CTERM system histidine kinase